MLLILTQHGADGAGSHTEHSAGSHYITEHIVLLISSHGDSVII